MKWCRRTGDRGISWIGGMASQYRCDLFDRRASKFTVILFRDCRQGGADCLFFVPFGFTPNASEVLKLLDGVSIDKIRVVFGDCAHLEHRCWIRSAELVVST